MKPVYLQRVQVLIPNFYFAGHSYIIQVDTHYYEAIPIPQSARKLPLVIRPKRFSKKGQRVRNELNLKDFFPSLFKGQTYKTFYTYQNDISIKSSNVKLNINDICNLIKLGKRAI